MNARLTSIDMADLPVQQPSAPQTAAQARARFFNSGNQPQLAFDGSLPALPPRAPIDVVHYPRLKSNAS